MNRTTTPTTTTTTTHTSTPTTAILSAASASPRNKSLSRNSYILLISWKQKIDGGLTARK